MVSVGKYSIGLITFSVTESNVSILVVTIHLGEKILSGIPQGSVLGPIVFVIFINDLPDVVNSYIHLFADDTKMYADVVSIEDKLVFQSDINKLCKWSMTSQLHCNATKCKVMHLGYSNQHYGNSMQDEEGDNVDLEETKVEKDLGVHIDNELKFSEHINKSVKKANSVLGIIKRNFVNFDSKTLCQLNH